MAWYFMRSLSQPPSWQARRGHDGGDLDLDVRGGGLAWAAVGRRGRLLLAVGGLLADERALRLRAVGRAVALPVADGLLADGLTDGLRVGALGVAERVLAHGVALRAAALLAVLHRAAHLALRLVALDLALGAAELLAACRALRRLADGLAHLVADRRVALPLALRVAVVVLAAVAT